MCIVAELRAVADDNGDDVLFANQKIRSFSMKNQTITKLGRQASLYFVILWQLFVVDQYIQIQTVTH